MASKGLSQAAVGAFKQNYEQLVAGVTGLVSTLHLLHLCMDSTGFLNESTVLLK